jgi:hypothetical protein
MTYCPLAKLFAEKKAGFLILFSLILSTEDDGLPLDKPMTASIAALSKAFAVSRPQIKLLFRAVVAKGALTPVSDEASNRFFLTEAMRDDCMRLMSGFWVLAACGVRAGVAALDAVHEKKRHHAVL